MSVTFYFVRHGMTVFNRLHQVQGWADSPLVDEGVRVARETGRHLARVDFVAAYASDKVRTRQTLAELLDARSRARQGLDATAVPDGAESPSTEGAAGLLATLENAAQATAAESTAPYQVDGIPFRSDPRLREWCYGDLEGGSGEHLHQRLIEGYGHDPTRDEENTYLPKTANVLAQLDKSGRAETFDAIEKRLHSFMEEAGSAALVSGGGNVLAVTHSFTIRTLVYLYAQERVAELPAIPNGSITRITYDGDRFTVHEFGATGPIE